MDNKSNAKLELARRIIEKTGTSLFLTGKAGTGKTTFLRELREHTRKRMVVTAPTGIAAINAGGVTLHSFFQLDFGMFIPGQTVRHAQGHGERGGYRFSKEKLKIIRGMDLLVIDEISMVRADLLDAVDDALRRLRDRTRPFGGVQLLLIGDLQQLPPVVKEEEATLLRQHYPSPYFFDSQALKQIHYETIELDEVFRQNDEEFLGILNEIRENRATPDTLRKLNSRVRMGFNPDDREGYIRLTTHNNLAARINDEHLDMLPTQDYYFESQVEGKFPESSYPADKTLRLKEGAQVMFIKNDTGIPRAYYNGMIGSVVAIDKTHGIAVMPSEGGEIIHVQPTEWENVTYSVDPETKELVEKREGIFRQYPLKPAWAVTIHKSQGLTFERAIIDVSRSFAHGQTYVALSRCRNLKGLVLQAPVGAQAIICDMTVNRYMETQTGNEPTPGHIEEMERAFRITLLDELFSFRQLFASMEGVVRLYQENFGRHNPEMVDRWAKTFETLRSEVNEVADKFRMQYSRLASDGTAAEPQLQQRVNAAANYFLGQMQPLVELKGVRPQEVKNKTVRKKLEERLDLFDDLLTTKTMLLNAFRTRAFNTDIYMDLKAEAMLRGTEAPFSIKKLKIKEKKEKEKKEKKPRGASGLETVEMFRKGMSPSEIAETRKLTFTTIYNHLTTNIPPSELKGLLDRLIRPEVKSMLCSYAESHPEWGGTLSEIRESMGNVPTWDEIRVALAAYGCSRKVPEMAQEPAASYGKPDDFLQ